MSMLVSLAVAIPLIFNPYNYRILSVIGFSFLIHAIALFMIPHVSSSFVEIGLFGKDRLKPHQTVQIPESIGSIIGVVYIFSVLVFTPFVLSTGSLTGYLSGVLSIQSMVMLGFADDLFDLRWRHKFFLPAIAAIPLLFVYSLEHGNTHIALPPFLNLGSSIDLKVFYYVYMAALSIFATNCVNIYAGVNGLEVGQVIVVALSVVANDCVYLVHDHFFNNLSLETSRAHVMSLLFVLPLIAGSLALLKYNWYPAKVFVGDAYCYFAGMVLAVAGILGHYSKTLLSLIFPQIINFLYSVPQLFRIVPCPRHRMPIIDSSTGLLLPSRADVTQLQSWKIKFLKFMAKLKLIRVWETNGKVEISNMTLINLVLVHTGPIREDRLTMTLLGIQVISCVLALISRHMLAKILFGMDNI